MKSQPPISAEAIQAAVNAAGSVREAAADMRIPVRTLYRWMKHYGIHRTPAVYRQAA